MRPPRWGLDVSWGVVLGAVRFRDPFTGEWHEVEGRWLPSPNEKTDLRWMRSRAGAARHRGASLGAGGPPARA